MLINGPSLTRTSLSPWLAQHDIELTVGPHYAAVTFGEMKIIADGVQVFRFWDGRWRLTDAQRKYDLWTAAISNSELGERLFVAALNLAEDRRGGLLVVLDDPATARNLVSRTDLLTSLPDRSQDAFVGTKDHLHYLLHRKRVLDISITVLETLARWWNCVGSGFQPAGVCGDFAAPGLG